MEDFILGVIILVGSLWFLYSAVCILYPFKPFRKRKHAALSFVSTFVVTFFVVIVFALVEVVTVPHEKVASEQIKEQKPKAPIVDNMPEVTSEVTTASNKNVPQKTSKNKGMFPDCKGDAQITRKRHDVIASKVNVRKGPGTEYERVINQKATDALKSVQYIQIDDSTVVFEECTKGEWSWIRVLEPDWLQDSHRGWVLSKYLNKGQDTGGDRYTRKIGRYALSPYDEKNYSKLVGQFRSRLKEIEQLRRKIAEIAIDSGKCDFVEASDLSDRSSLQHLHFWVDCRNRERIRLDEFEIKKRSAVFTQREKAWDENSARTACREAIKSRALIPSELDIHDIFGTSFYEAPVTHNVVLTMNFDAKNAFGVEFSYTAKCYFKPGEVGEIELYARQ